MPTSFAYLPNFITILRFLLTIPIVWTLLKGYSYLALVLFVVAAVTDYLDGWLARRYIGWSSKWGAFLDPLADKTLLVSTFITLSYLSYLPSWVIMVAIGRDCAIVLGILIYRLWIGPLHYSPIYSSKVNTALQISLILMLLIQKTLWNLPNSLIKLNSMMMVATSLVSFIHYVVVWFSKVQYHVKAKL